MGLDAAVYCDCYETGRLRRPPPQPELVYVDENGQVCLKWVAPGADQFAFFDWLGEACEHGPLGQLVSHRLGNIAQIGFLRSILSKWPDQFPVLLTKVVYDGTHAGGSISLVDIERLRPEIEQLAGIHGQGSVENEILSAFQRQMMDLIEAACRVRKPIVF